jgi:hypothetical protein
VSCGDGFASQWKSTFSRSVRPPSVGSMAPKRSRRPAETSRAGICPEASQSAAYSDAESEAFDASVGASVSFA